jgi:hypothetical protein
MRKMKTGLLILGILLAVLVGVCLGAATATVNLTCSIAGLGSSSPQLSISFTDDVTPDTAAYFYTTIATPNTAEAIALGDVSTIEGILMKADACDVEVDCDFNSTNFDADIVIERGEAAYFMPSGTVYVKNQDAGESIQYEYVIFGAK